MCAYDPDLYQNKYNINSNRHTWHDYAMPGYYFITICTHQFIQYFGRIVDDNMIYNKYGRIAQQQILHTPTLRPYVNIDTYVVMPNHVHVIVEIKYNIYAYKNKCVETRSIASLHKYKQPHNKFGPQSHNLASIICGYKSAVTKQIYQTGYKHFAWQPNYYDHIIRDEQSLQRICEYIIHNPVNWKNDHNYLQN